MDVSDSSRYSAAPSLLGYIYQCRIALLETLRRLKANPGVIVSIETLDDVVFEKDGNPTEIIQTKHHINREANLTDSSSDLWKTIRIWSDLFKSGITAADTILCMMTTAEATTDSAAYYLRPLSKNVPAAQKKLVETALTSTSKANSDAYDMFMSLGTDQQSRMLESAVLIDKCPSCAEVNTELQKEVWSACQRSHIPQFLLYLEGWWLTRIVKSLISDRSMPILGEECDAYFNELREQLKSDSLPIHSDLRTAQVDGSLYRNHTFVRQLRLIEVTDRRIAIAVNNFYRAFEQRSRWLREELLLVGDIDYYENRLIEEWQARFETMRENLGDVAAEQDKVRQARAIYDWVEKQAHIPIRPQCHEAFITRGSYHILSDRKMVGWHPDFLERLVTILDVPEMVK